MDFVLWKQRLEAGDEFVAEGAFGVDMAEDGGDERIGIEVAADLTEVLELLLAGAVCTEGGHEGKGELFLGIFIDHAVEGNHCILPAADDAADVGGGDLLGRNAVEFLYPVVCPAPFPGVIVGGH